MKRPILIIIPLAMMALVAWVFYLMAHDNEQAPPRESPNNRIEGISSTPTTLQPKQEAFPRAYAAVADDPCEWSYYFWGSALLVDTLMLEGGKAKAPLGNTVTGYVVDHDLWYPEITLTVPKALSLEEALQRIQPPYGHIVRWLSGPNFYLVKPGCDEAKGQFITPTR